MLSYDKCMCLQDEWKLLGQAQHLNIFVPWNFYLYQLSYFTMYCKIYFPFIKYSILSDYDRSNLHCHSLLNKRSLQGLHTHTSSISCY